MYITTRYKRKRPAAAQIWYSGNTAVHTCCNQYTIKFSYHLDIYIIRYKEYKLNIQIYYENNTTYENWANSRFYIFLNWRIIEQS